MSKWQKNCRQWEITEREISKSFDKFLIIFLTQIASHPNTYILDTPGVLFPEVADDDYGSKLALTGVKLI